MREKASLTAKSDSMGVVTHSLAWGSLQVSCSISYNYGIPTSKQSYYSALISMNDRYFKMRSSQPADYTSLPTLTRNPSTHSCRTSKAREKVYQPEDTTADEIAQELIKELTHKNKLLANQIVEYKTIVGNLNQRIDTLTKENEQLREKVPLTEQKLHTIMEEMSIMEHTVSSCNRVQDQCAIQLSQVMQEQLSQEFGSDSPSWERMLQRVSIMTMKYRQMDYLLQRIAEMKERIEPGASQGLDSLWRWLLKLGTNYWYLTDWKGQVSTRQNSERY